MSRPPPARGGVPLDPRIRNRATQVDAGIAQLVEFETMVSSKETGTGAESNVQESNQAVTAGRRGRWSWLSSLSKIFVTSAGGGVVVPGPFGMVSWVPTPIDERSVPESYVGVAKQDARTE